jgi:hypothetical protein
MEIGMGDRLFEGSWYATWQNVLHAAARDVEQLDRKIFSDPALAGHLQRIAEKYSFDVARLNKEGIEGKRRDTQREGADIWGDHRVFKQTLRIPTMTTTRSDGWRPPVPIDDDHGWRGHEGAVRCIC